MIFVMWVIIPILDYLYLSLSILIVLLSNSHNLGLDLCKLWFLHSLCFLLKSSWLGSSLLTYRSSTILLSPHSHRIILLVIPCLVWNEMHICWGSCGWVHRFSFSLWFILSSFWVYCRVISKSYRLNILLLEAHRIKFTVFLLVYLLWDIFLYVSHCLTKFT